MSNHFCSIIPPHILDAIANSEAAPQAARDKAVATLAMAETIREQRKTDLQSVPAGIVPSHVLDSIIRSETADAKARESAQRTLDASAAIRQERVVTTQDQRAAVVGHLNRNVYDCHGTIGLPGTLVRSEGGAAVTDRPVNNCYNGLGITFNFYLTVFGRNSIDDAGIDLTGSVHYATNFDNAFWNGSQMIFGDGDGVIFDDFTGSLDVIAHELTHGVTQYTSRLHYHDQPGALNESISDVFGCMVEQYHIGQLSSDADWLIGQRLLDMTMRGAALRSLKAPGTAYNDPILGKDPQPAHMRDYNNTASDNGGVHINSGIPNHAFYLVCRSLGGHSWERPGRIWYNTITDARMTPEIDFKHFAELTVDNAHTLFGVLVKALVKEAWIDVGVLQL